jgi:hypothetical protein
MAFVIITCLGICLFVAGYYFGNQMGRTEFIRGYLATLRKKEI